MREREGRAKRARTYLNAGGEQNGVNHQTLADSERVR